MIGYKLVFHNDYDEFISAWTPDHPYGMKYKVGEFVEARVGGLLLFNTLEHAMDFSRVLLNASDHWQLWECEMEEVLPLPEKAALHTKDFITLWAGMSKDIEVFPWPKGTIAARRVKLVKRVA